MNSMQSILLYNILSGCGVLASLRRNEAPKADIATTPEPPAFLTTQ